ncbi:thiolase family protein [Oenococcus sicerae]|uniref:acetyl-CoA C-acetyltransferase n=1 Tax=Oenococcus sicerae TaxID=2203724 RepID=A0AAJ1RCU4_9LACO|nr:thiolase family protein [Oenococcus sicerae]MDN6900402.1 thiolase family protein [Oenococcus sicerae]
MQKVFIVAAARTPIGKFGGLLKNKTAVELATIVIKSLLLRSKIAASQIDEVYMGNVLQAGEGPNPARQASLLAGLPISVPASTINDVCGSGLQAINLSAKLIASGFNDLILAGGMESMSNAPFLLSDHRFGQKLGNEKLEDGLLRDALVDPIAGIHMGITAENIAEKYHISRQDMDAYSLLSHQRAVAADQHGAFNDELIPLTELKKDQAPRTDTSLEQLSKLKTVFKTDGKVTAGNASGINDGAAGVILASEKKVAELGLSPLAEWQFGNIVGVDPEIMGIGPVFAIRDLYEKTGLADVDIDFYELNEAYAAQVLADVQVLNLDLAKVNPNGGAIALGHPVGASGARILVTLVYDLIHGNRKRGIASLCVGGGMGLSTLIKRL